MYLFLHLFCCLQSTVNKQKLWRSYPVNKLIWLFAQWGIVPPPAERLKKHQHKRSYVLQNSSNLITSQLRNHDFALLLIICLHLRWGKPDPCMNSPVIYGEKVWLLLLERAAVCTQSLSVLVSLSFWSCVLFVPQLSIHILKPYITGIKPTVSARDSLIYWWVPSVSVSFMIEVKGQGHTDTFLTRSLFDYRLLSRSLFAQLDQRELQGRMLMSLLKKTIEFQHTSQPASCCRAPAQENTTLFIPDPPSKCET